MAFPTTFEASKPDGIAMKTAGDNKLLQRLCIIRGSSVKASAAVTHLSVPAECTRAMQLQSQCALCSRCTGVGSRDMYTHGILEPL